MTPEERDALVERMAEAICAENVKHGGEPWHTLPEVCTIQTSKHWYRALALAALSEAEPVVRADEREAATNVLDTRVAEIRADQMYWGGPDMTNGNVLNPELARLASAIRARGDA